MKTITRGGQLNEENRKTPDAGFSLIELLVAVTILAIIVIPLLHMFVTSTRINVKSRQKLRATTLAQDIMEGLKAYTLEEVSAQFEPPDGMGGNTYHYPADGFYILNSSLIQGGVQDLTDQKAEYEGVYYFGIENLKLQDGEYDALIRLDASTYGKYRNAHDGYNRRTPHDNLFNDKSYAEIGSVAETNGGGDETDSSYHESKLLSGAVLDDVKPQIEQDIMDAGGTLPDRWDELDLEDIVDTRTIRIVISDAGDGQCKAAVTFTYDCSYTYNGTKYTYTSNGHDGSAAGRVVDIPRTFTSGKFYLFYYPIYSTRMIDKIEFEIKDPDKVLDEANPLLKEIVVAKQIRSDVRASENLIVPELPLTGPESLYEKEDAYVVREIRVTPSVPLTRNLIFKTNLYTNLADGSDADQVNHYVNPYVMSYALTGDITSDKVTNVIYDIEIRVYEGGAARHFTDSRDNYDFEDNDEVQKLATITNVSD
ncbi:MAG: prepilin-type N-terminal cleavage/methylation domain-containing protein [Eubacterium sp.]|nr:prepilin-type N-terminal cleavage/methylation domain-containing protein [Eubacterium sp.]